MPKVTRSRRTKAAYLIKAKYAHLQNRQKMDTDVLLSRQEELVKELRKEFVDKHGKSRSVESQAIQILEPHLGPVVAVRDGSKADLAIPDEGGGFKGIQIKSCTCRNEYGKAQFSNIGGYNMPIVCYLHDEKRIWLLRGEDVFHLKGSMHVAVTSKYNQYEVTSEELQSKLNVMLQSYPAHDMEYWNSLLPTKKLVEYMGDKLMKAHMDVLEKKVGDIEDTVYDVVSVSGKKIQRKVACFRKKYSTGFYVPLFKNAGNVNGKRTTSAYHQNDDFELFQFIVLKYGNGELTHNDDQDAIRKAHLVGYFEIPKRILQKKGYIATEKPKKSKGKKCMYTFLPTHVCELEKLPLPKLKIDDWSRDYFHYVG